MSKRRLNRETVQSDPQHYSPVQVAHTYTFVIPVRNGAVYLDMMRPGWARRVKAGTLDMGSRSHSILAQVYGQHESEVHEFMTWSNRSLRAHGFLVMSDDRMVAGSLTIEWVIAIQDRLNTVGQ